jgi:hypothetical protein
MELVRRFTPEQYANALESWAWIGVADMVPICTSAFGDVFLQSANGTVFFLDTIEGTLTAVWESIAALQADLNTAEGRDQYLVPGLVAEAGRRGIVPSRDQVLDFLIPPILGGSTDIDNVQVCPFEVSVNLSGQMHYQVKDLPPGTVIGGATIRD